MYRTAEFVSPKHPDKICDRISDRILDYCLEQDRDARVAVETMGGHGCIYVNGEVTINTKKEIRLDNPLACFRTHKKPLGGIKRNKKPYEKRREGCCCFTKC